MIEKISNHNINYFPIHVSLESERDERLYHSLSTHEPKKLNASRLEEDRNYEFTAMSYTLPHLQNGDSTGGIRRRMGTQSPTYYDERREDSHEDDHGRKLLMFHGIILRSQLIELLKNKVFFSEDDGVSLRRSVFICDVINTNELLCSS